VCVCVCLCVCIYIYIYIYMYIYKLLYIYIFTSGVGETGRWHPITAENWLWGRQRSSNYSESALVPPGRGSHQLAGLELVHVDGRAGTNMDSWVRWS